MVRRIICPPVEVRRPATAGCGGGVGRSSMKSRTAFPATLKSTASASTNGFKMQPACRQLMASRQPPRAYPRPVRLQRVSRRQLRRELPLWLGGWRSDVFAHPARPPGLGPSQRPETFVGICCGATDRASVRFGTSLKPAVLLRTPLILWVASSVAPPLPQDGRAQLGLDIIMKVSPCCSPAAGIARHHPRSTDARATTLPRKSSCHDLTLPPPPLGIDHERLTDPSQGRDFPAD